MENIYAIILAAGKGTRMNSEALPKVLFPLGRQTMLEHALAPIHAFGIEKPVIIIGFLGHLVKEKLGPAYVYVNQEQQLGTAHAVLMARPVLEGKKGCTIIVTGDHPFFKVETLQRLTDAVLVKGATISVLTIQSAEPEFDAFGRVITDNDGHVLRIVEKKDANPEELSASLRNLSAYAVDNSWLWPVLERIEKSPVSGEYYLTDIVGEAVREGKKVFAVPITDPAEALGINTPEHLAEAEQILARQ